MKPINDGRTAVYSLSAGLGRVMHNAAPFLVPLLVLSIWQYGTSTGFLPRSLVSTPAAVAAKAVQMTTDGTLAAHALISIRRLAAGFLGGSLLGVAVGLTVGCSQFANRLFKPTISVVAPIPVTAWIPLIIIVAGIGETSKYAIIAIGSFFPVFYSTLAGVASTDPRLIEVAQVLGKTRVRTLSHIMIPSAVGFIFQGMRTALGLSWVLIIVAEVVASSDGLGWLMWDARNFARPDEMIVAMLAAGVLGASTAGILSWTERYLLYWRPQIEDRST